MSVQTITINPTTELPHKPILADPRAEFQSAIQNGSIEGVFHGVKIDEVALDDPLPNGELPLHEAIKRRQTEVAEKLFELGASSSIKGSDGLSAIDHAALSKDKPLLSLLLHSQLQQELETSEGKLPQLKGQYDQMCQDTVTLGLTASPPIGKLDLIQLALLNGEYTTFEKLVESSDLNVITKEGNSLMHLAALRVTDPRFVNKLIELGLKVDVTNKKGQTPLHYAALYANYAYGGKGEERRVFQALVNAGASPHTKDNEGLSPLHTLYFQAVKLGNARDPLKLSYSQWFTFAFAALSMSSYIAKETGYLSPEATELLGAVKNSANACALISVFFDTINQAGEGNWNRLQLALILNCFVHIIPMPLYTAITTYFCTTGAYQGIKTAFNNSYRGWDAFKSGFMHATNGLYVLNKAKTQVDRYTHDYNSWREESAAAEIPTCEDKASFSSEKEFYTQRCFEVLSKDTLTQDEKVVPISKLMLHCNKVGKTVNDNPYTPCFRDLSRKWHPDRGGDDKVFINLGNAQEVLRKHYYSPRPKAQPTAPLKAQPTTPLAIG